jgi:hypothetical protein
MVPLFRQLRRMRGLRRDVSSVLGAARLRCLRRHRVLLLRKCCSSRSVRRRLVLLGLQLGPWLASLCRESGLRRCGGDRGRRGVRGLHLWPGQVLRLLAMRSRALGELDDLSRLLGRVLLTGGNVRQKRVLVSLQLLHLLLQLLNRLFVLRLLVDDELLLLRQLLTEYSDVCVMRTSRLSELLPKSVIFLPQQVALQPERGDALRQALNKTGDWWQQRCRAPFVDTGSAWCRNGGGGGGGGGGRVAARRIGRQTVLRPRRG